MTNKIYVVNRATVVGDISSLTVIDGATNTTATVADLSGAGGVAVNPVTNKVYVAGDSVTVIDGATNAVTPR